MLLFFKKILLCKFLNYNIIYIDAPSPITHPHEVEPIPNSRDHESVPVINLPRPHTYRLAGVTEHHGSTESKT